MRQIGVWRIRAGTACVQATLLTMLACGHADDTGLIEDEEPATEFADSRSRAVPALADGEIVHVVMTANTADSLVAELARMRSAHPAVIRFAEVITADHHAVNAELERLTAQLALRPLVHQHSRELQQSATAARAALDTLSGPVFDRTYILREIEYHRNLVKLFDETLIPSARNTDVRTLLENIRPAVAAHLQRAEQIRSMLGS